MIIFFDDLHVLYKLWTWILYTVLQIKSKHECVVRFWLKWRNYGSVSNSFSCTTWTQILELLFKSGLQRFFISLKFRSKHQNLMVHFSKLLSVTLRSGIEKPPRKHIVFFKYAQFLLAHFIILVGNMKTSETLSVSQIVLMFECPIWNSNLKWNLIFSHSSYLNMICDV